MKAQENQKPEMAHLMPRTGSKSVSQPVSKLGSRMGSRRGSKKDILVLLPEEEEEDSDYEVDMNDQENQWEDFE